LLKLQLNLEVPVYLEPQNLQKIFIFLQTKNANGKSNVGSTPCQNDHKPYENNERKFEKIANNSTPNVMWFQNML
jgi:hypothetical protein